MQVEQMPNNSWCAIKSKEEWEFFKQIHKGISKEDSRHFSGFENVVLKNGRIILHRVRDGNIFLRNGWLNNNEDLTKTTPEYKLPIPEGWRLADKEKDSKANGWRIYDQWIRNWQDPCEDLGDFVPGGVYAVPDTTSEPPMFPAKHYFLKKAENRKAFAEKFPMMKWIDGESFNPEKTGLHFEAIGHGYIEKSPPGVAAMTHGKVNTYENNGHTRYYFEHEFKVGDIAVVKGVLFSNGQPEIGEMIEVSGKRGESILYTHKGVELSAHETYFRHATSEEKLSRFKVGDIVVVAHPAISLSGSIGQVCGEPYEGHVKIRLCNSGVTHHCLPDIVRHATEEEKLQLKASSWRDTNQPPEPATKLHTTVSLPEEVLTWLQAAEGIHNAMSRQSKGCTLATTSKTTNEPEGSINISPVTSAAQVSGATTSDGEKANMLTQSEKEEILALVRGEKSSSGNVAGKTAGFVGRSIRGLAKWAIAPARPVGRVALKLVQYTVFFAGAGAGAYSAYYAYNHAGSFMPFEIRMKKEDPSPSDDKTRQITDFITTGGINT